MQTASLAKYHPRLQGIFGPLSKPRLEYIWQVLTQIDVELLRLAAHFGHNSAGWEKTGLELSWAQSGQLFLGSFVGTTDPESHAADFVVELWPSWCHDEPRDTVEWIVAATIEVDCQHQPDHSGMDTVFNREQRRCQTPEQAVEQLLLAAKDLLILAMEHPIDYWTSKTRS